MERWVPSGFHLGNMRPGKLRTLEKDCRGDRDFILDPYARIPRV